jgi:Tfp pilus assembly PilM family ATPase
VSPSWTSRWFRWSAGPKASVGIAIGRREVCAVHAVLGEKGAHVKTVHSVPLPDDVFAGPPTPAAESALASAFVKVAAEARGKYIPCHVALPDPTMSFTVFELNELPKSGKTRLELVRWRFAKEHATPDQALDCDYQELGQENGKHLLLGQAADNAWLQCIRRALQHAGIVPWSMNLGAAYRFNQFHDRFAREKHGAAMVLMDPDSWSVFLWDAATRPRMARARWRAGTDDGPETYDRIALEAERSILSYVRSGNNGSVTRVYAASHASELEGLAAALDRRLREKCVPLTAAIADPEKSLRLQDHALASLSLAAATAA